LDVRLIVMIINNKKNVRFLNLSLKNKKEKAIYLNAISKVLDHGYLVMGPEIELLENKISIFCKRKYCISANSGTDALYLAIKSLGYEPGSEVITSSLSWIATANAISLNHLTPVFCDIGYDLNMDPGNIESLISNKTKAILAVNYTGKICDMDKLISICKKNKIDLIEDGSQSFGAKYKGRINGSFGKISAISHNPMKVFGALGESGSILVDQSRLREKLISLRYNGTINKEKCIYPSLNGRMDTIQAAVLIEKMKLLKSVIKKRRTNASYYSSELNNILELPIEKKYEKDVYYTYTIKSDKRNKLMNYLNQKGIETKIQHPLLMPQQPAYKKNVKGSFKNAEKIIKTVLCIPIHENLKESELEYVTKVIKSFYG